MYAESCQNAFVNSTLHQASLISFHSRSTPAKKEAEKVIYFDFIKTLHHLPQYSNKEAKKRDLEEVI